MAEPNDTPPEDAKSIDDADLEASLEEPASESAEDVHAAVKEMIRAIRKAVA